MRKVRSIVSLLLCLAVPTAGWGSAMHDVLCGHDEAAAFAAADHDAGAITHAASADGHGADQFHHGGHAGHEKADGDHACPSPVGAMAVQSSWSYAASPNRPVVIAIAEPHLAAAHRISLLRPPIS